MIIREQTITIQDLHPEYIQYLPKELSRKAVFYDIETTGLGWRSSHIYLIGMLFQADSVWTLRQWFLDRPFAEKELLQDASDFLACLDPAVLVDYNGSTFDLPYLTHKCLFYNIPVPEIISDQTLQHHWDLLRLLRPLRSKLPLQSLKLQDVESLLHTGRSDHSSGKDLIEVYYRFLQTGDPSLAEQLFLHNHDDVIGLPSVASLLSFPDFWGGGFRVSERLRQPSSINFELSPASGFPVTFVLNGQPSPTFRPDQNDNVPENLRLIFENTKATLTVPVYEGERKLFFPDPRNYYYLPDEDQAIHKSVGAFTDPAFRTQAKASTCYRRVQGRFLPVPSDPSIPGLHCFFRDYGEKTGWIREEDLLSCEQDKLYLYVRSVLDGFFRSGSFN